ncbi:hypothetical protein AVT69_gp321 [Pseudomonas phage PhiPA3]|uniref:Uncharacterized protein 323 n=1 Tax=Pseudomonas phage PhiPA3 TaxID=998086 RepID=F8SJF9_BPPA3|nr:hypothetical protein AVT69_gp321 [Pseudomonas phage PhiPA3]AEH03746.1 hypothetical protein [Pseudomonas phage PhiPA3]
MTTQEKLNYIREFCPRMLDVELNFPGNAQLWQLLGTSSIKHGSYVALGGGDSSKKPYDEELWTRCLEVNTWVAVIARLVERQQRKYSWENPINTNKSIIAWAPSFDEAVGILYNWIKEHATDERGAEYSTSLERRFVKFD